MSTAERVIPILVYRDIQVAYDYLINVFGLASGGVDRDPQGSAVHAEVQASDATLWLHRETEDHRLVSAEKANAAGFGITVIVSDVDAHFARARKAGARIKYEPVDQPYGQREYEVVDLEGHRWWNGFSDLRRFCCVLRFVRSWWTQESCTRCLDLHVFPPNNDFQWSLPT